MDFYTMTSLPLSWAAIIISLVSLVMSLIPAIAGTLRVSVDPNDGADATLVFSAFGKGLIWGIEFQRVPKPNPSDGASVRELKQGVSWEKVGVALAGGQVVELEVDWDEDVEYQEIEVRYWSLFLPRKTFVSSTGLGKLHHTRGINHYWSGRPAARPRAGA